MTQPSIPGLASLRLLSSSTDVHSYQAVSDDGVAQRVFITEDEDTRHRFATWSKIDAHSRWLELDEGGALICPWPDEASADAALAARKNDSKATLQSLLPILDMLADAHELDLAHGDVRLEELRIVDSHFHLPPPRSHVSSDAMVTDLSDATQLIRSALLPDSDATLVTNDREAENLDSILGIISQDATSVSELRGRLRSVFGDENQQPTIISSQMSSSSQPPEMPDQIGAFKLRGLLGKGGMGYVYEAYDPHLDRTVALKTVRLDVLGEAGKDRFLREARACSRISHPNVVTVYSAGEVDGDPFMAMELIRGRTLTRCLREDNVEWQELVSWVIQILGALELLHAEGIVHRDLKPENIMLTESGVPKLMDFGLAHMATAAQITATGVMLGTVHYMSPEQVLGTEIDARSDVFSMGVLLHRELSGNFPFEASHPMSVMYAIRNAPTPDIDVRAAGIPVELAQVITRALEKNPDDRYASAGPFRDALMELVSEEEVAAATKSSRTPWVIAAATILLATLGILWSINRGGDEPDRDAAIALNELGQSLVAGGEVAQARAEFRRALVADESYAVAWNNLGMLAFGEGELAEADSFLARASELDEHYAIARFNHGRVLEDRANPEAAIQSYAAAVTADSSFAAGYNNLAAVLLDLERSSEARDVVMTGLTKTLREDPARPFLHRTAGRVYWQLDEADSAIEQWELSLVDLADDTTLLELLGEALLQARSLEAARPHWERLLELGDDAQKARAAQVLEND